MQILKDATKISYDWSFYLAWTGVGFTLASAILFSGAAICLRGEREREEAVNMQYIMPGNFIVLHHNIYFGKEKKKKFLLNTPPRSIVWVWHGLLHQSKLFLIKIFCIE